MLSLLTLIVCLFVSCNSPVSGDTDESYPVSDGTQAPSLTTADDITSAESENEQESTESVSVADTAEDTADSAETTAEETTDAVELITLSDEELRDKLLGIWIGQMAGVSFFAPTEFCYNGVIIPEDRIDSLERDWRQENIGINDAFKQDDLYVEVPFMDAMKENGAFCDVEYIAEKFRDSTFPLWHANYEGRANLLSGLSWRESGHFLYNKHCDDIDWQIECDFLGAMYPGYVSDAAARSFELGHIMNYGDGVYGGVFVTAMHSAAYTADSISEIVDAGMAVIPDNTLFKDTMNLVCQSYNAGDTWEECWQKVEDKYGSADKCPPLKGEATNIDAKLNSAYILIGLLWGDGDFEQTMIISGRCGQDSDCNPSSAASIIGNFCGASNIPDKWKNGLDYSGTVFDTTDYTLEEIVELNYDLMKEVLLAKSAVYSDGIWTFAKEKEYTPVEWEQWTDEFCADLVCFNQGNGVIKLRFAVNGEENISSVTVDMGDGFVANGCLSYYSYASPGEYTVKYSIVNEKGEVAEGEEKVVISKGDARLLGEPICTYANPNGGGLDAIFDGYIPNPQKDGSWQQCDTWDGGSDRSSVYAGVEFYASATLSGVDFTEGCHFYDGGWFVAQPSVEVLLNGEWKCVDTSISKAYPDGNTTEAHGAPFETYTFSFAQPIACDGVRIVGAPGGSARFISIGEITPLISEGAEIEFASEKIPLIICSTNYPTGGGNKDIRVIADGKVLGGSMGMYDTYDGARPNSREYIGYLYKEALTVTELVFAEGEHFEDGGWFKNGNLWI